VLTLAQTRDIKSDQRQQTKTTLSINQSVFEFQKSRDRRQAREKSVWSKTRVGLVSLLLVEKQCVWFDCLKRFNNTFFNQSQRFLNEEPRQTQNCFRTPSENRSTDGLSVFSPKTRVRREVKHVHKELYLFSSFVPRVWTR